MHLPFPFLSFLSLLCSFFWQDIHFFLPLIFSSLTNSFFYKSLQFLELEVLHWTTPLVGDPSPLFLTQKHALHASSSMTTSHAFPDCSLRSTYLHLLLHILLHHILCHSGYSTPCTNISAYKVRFSQRHDYKNTTILVALVKQLALTLTILMGMRSKSLRLMTWNIP